LLPFLVRLACVRHAASVDSEPGSNSRLKPDACRRVEGRLASSYELRALSGLKTATHVEAATLALERRSGTSCEIVQTYARMISHDWHVQPSCQRPNRGPPERREFSPGGDTQVRLRLSSKPYKHTGGKRSCQRPQPTGFPDDFHIGRIRVGAAGELHAKPKAGSSPDLRSDSE
jgi:hypothetical protein